MLTEDATAERTLLLTVDDVGELAKEHGKPAETLGRIVQLLAERFGADVCSIYLLEPSRDSLLLAATVGLRPESVGHIRMRLEEGLVGLVAEELRSIAVDDVTSHVRFKHFPESGEDSFRSFLGVPLTDANLLNGVLIVQTAESRRFSEAEQSALLEAGKQIAPIIKEARTLEQFIAPAHEKLWALARNLRWCWDSETVALFRDLEDVRWRQLNHNAVALLKETSLDTVEREAGRRVLHSRINYSYRRLREYLKNTSTWGATHAGVLGTRPVAYFSAEFGLHESIPIYSGGLGVLAGDHIKSASDLGIPLVGIGLLYSQGYFHQRLDMEKWQQEEYVETDLSQLPLELALDGAGKPIVVSVATRKSTISARVWKAAVGRNTLLLLDANIDGNDPEDRLLTARLYGGDEHVRIHQELLLGVGGLRALRALGIEPGVLHLNEGHSAFATLEQIRDLMQTDGHSFDAAVQEVRRQTVFTTHTPVPAGHDRFSASLIEENLGLLREKIGLSHDQLMALGRVQQDNPDESFCMTVLALKMAQRCNGVSSLHGVVSRNMWQCMWPERETSEIPIGHITNGVHVLSWLAPQMQQLFDRHLGVNWLYRSGQSETWDGIDAIDDGELWETHQALKLRLIDFVRRHAAEDAQRRGESKRIVKAMANALSPDTLTIGFARRFATYKRANLLLSDLEVLAKLVNDTRRPVQVVFAGKAHPRDNPGKKVLQAIGELMCVERFLGKIVFVEDYDINIGRHLVQGVDVWLNNPQRPLEASGTSGQKVVLNGGLNLSVLDGWWAEAYDGANGFAIGNGRVHRDQSVQDASDGKSLMQTLKKEVIPMYYRRTQDGIPREWVHRMKRGMKTLGSRFSADRMVMDYVLNCYVPAAGGTSCVIPT